MHLLRQRPRLLLLLLLLLSCILLGLVPLSQLLQEQIQNWRGRLLLLLLLLLVVLVLRMLLLLLQQLEFLLQVWPPA
jgi:hypothetical protein